MMKTYELLVENPTRNTKKHTIRFEDLKELKHKIITVFSIHEVFHKSFLEIETEEDILQVLNLMFPENTHTFNKIK